MIEKDSKCPDPYVLYAGDKLRVTHEINLEWDMENGKVIVGDSLGWGEI